MKNIINKLEIFNTEYKSLLGYAINLSNDTIANDALQLVFVYLTNKPLESFKDPEHVKHWLIWTTKVTCYELNRKENRYIHLEDDYIDTKNSYNVKPYESHDRSMLNKAFRKAVSVLYPLQRKCIVLYYLEDKNRHEIAELLNTTPNAVNACICSGIKSLKKFFKNVDELEMFETK